VKKFLLILVIISGTGFINLDTVNADPTLESQISTDYKPATEMGPTFIDDVPVPYNVLVYAQVVYQGFAVTQAEEITIYGKKAYRLRVDNDSNPNYSKGFYLIYDENWKIIEKKPLINPAPKRNIQVVEEPIKEQVASPVVSEPTPIETLETPVENDEAEPSEDENNEETQPDDTEKPPEEPTPTDGPVTTENPNNQPNTRD
jgi:hypothetical protein